MTAELLLMEHHLKFLSLTGGCTGSNESTLVQMTHRHGSYGPTQDILVHLYLSHMCTCKSLCIQWPLGNVYSLQ